jgi:ATP-binding protein involved in chromosome partitioning
MAQLTKHTLLGVIENMAYFVCPACEEKHYVFGRGGALEIARATDSKLLGRIPLDEKTRQDGDRGEPIALDAASLVGQAFRDIAATLDSGA